MTKKVDEPVREDPDLWHPHYGNDVKAWLDAEAPPKDTQRRVKKRNQRPA